MDLGDGTYFVYNSASNTLSLGGGGGPTPEPLKITSFTAVDGQPGVWQISLTGNPADYVRAEEAP